MVNTPYQLQGHRVKVKVTKFISIFCRVFANFFYLFLQFSQESAKNAQKCSLGPYAEILGGGILNFCSQGQILKVKGQTLKYAFDSLNDLQSCSCEGHNQVQTWSTPHINFKVTGSKSRSQSSFPIFVVFLQIFSISSYSFHRRVLKMHINFLWDYTQRSQAAEFLIFAFKVKY